MLVDWFNSAEGGKIKVLMQENSKKIIMYDNLFVFHCHLLSYVSTVLTMKKDVSETIPDLQQQLKSLSNQSLILNSHNAQTLHDRT